MKQAILILRKDVRHLWPRLLVFLLAAMGCGVIEFLVPRSPALAGVETGCQLLLLLGSFILGVSVVQEDSVCGARRFVLTRPISGWSLLLAKLLFLLLFLNLPILLVQIAVLTATDFASWVYSAKFFWHEIALAGAVLCGVALGAITADLAQALIVIILSVAVSIALQLALDGARVAGAAGPVMNAWADGVSVAIAAAVWILQFWRRALRPARWLYACGVVAPTLVIAAAPWGAGFALTARDSPTVRPEIAQVSFDSDREVQTWRKGQSPFSHQDIIGVALPVSVSGIPAGWEAYTERILVTVEAADGKHWSSGWSSENQIRLEPPRGIESERLLRADRGPYRLFIDADRSFCRDFCGQPVNLHATAAFTLLGNARSAQVTEEDRPRRMWGDMFCQNSKIWGLNCVAPLEAAAETSVHQRSVITGAVIDEQDYFSAGSTPASPLSVWIRVTPGLRYGYQAPHTIFVATRETVGYFERSLDVRGVRLGMVP